METAAAGLTVRKPERGHMVFDALDAEHLRQYRAERILAFLRDVWGDDMPDTPNPEVTVLIDAVAIDDVLGGEDGFVVQGDGLAYSALAELVRRAHDVRPEALLAARLLARLGPRTSPSTADPSAAVLSELVTRAERPVTVVPGAGAWDLDEGTRIFTWDSSFARLKGVGVHGDSQDWDEHVERTVHPADQSDVHDSMDRTFGLDLPFEVSYRTRTSISGWTWVRASGRRISPPASAGARVIGLVAV